MSRFFDVYDPNPFVAYSPSHLAALLVMAASALFLYTFRHWLKQGTRRHYARFTLFGVLILSEVSLNVWYVQQDIYDVKYTLPLELCSISLYLCAGMLLFKSRRLFQIAYFTGIGGAVQALLTPVLWYAYPHYRFFEFFGAHIAIILAVLYMVWIEEQHPTLKSIAVTMVFLNVLLVGIGTVNAVTGGNYMFLARKPNTASMLDFLGPHPWYILSLQAVALVMFLLLYLPFAASSRRKTAGKERSV